jgi:serine/threonine protein kinase
MLLGKGTHGVIMYHYINNEHHAVKTYRKFPVIPPEAFNELLVYRNPNINTPRYHGSHRVDSKEMLLIEMCRCNLYELSKELSPHGMKLWIKRNKSSLCKDLRLLHSNGWTHGDISPLNILVSFSGRPYFCDFGLSNPPLAYVRYGGSDGFTAPICGSRHFHTDWWSLAATFYYCLTGTFFNYETSDITVLPKSVRKWLDLDPIRRSKPPILSLPCEELGPKEIPSNIDSTLKLISSRICVEVVQLASDILRRYSSWKELTTIHYPVALEIANKFVLRLSLVQNVDDDYEEFRVVELDILETLQYKLLTNNFYYRVV